MAAVIELKSWMGISLHIFDGETPVEIIEKFEEVQSLHCLLMMGSSEERSAKGKKEIEKLRVFLNKYENGELTLSDIENLSVTLSVGTIRCIAVADNAEKINELLKEYGA